MNRRAFLASLAAGGLAIASTARPGRILAQDAMSGSDPMTAAVELSRLESTTYIPALYTLYGYIHPDAEALVPRATVIGWYQNDFQPRGPQVATATGVTWLNEWAWPVTGKVYTNVAEVSYTQYFNDGSVDYEKVRLVYHDNAWRWFFGRDRAWVDQQNHRFSLKDHTPQAGVAPYGLDALPDLRPEILKRLPTSIFDQQFSTQYSLEESAPLDTDHPHLLPQQGYRYRAVSPPSEFPLGRIEHGTIKAPRSGAENMDTIAWETQNAPPVIFEGWNTTPERGPAWLLVTFEAVDVVGPAQSLTLVSDATYVRVHMFSEASLQLICEAIAGSMGGR